MKELFLFLSLSICAGCSLFDVDDNTVTTTTFDPRTGISAVVVDHSVDVTRLNCLMNTSVEQTHIKYGQVTVDVGGYSQKGDTESIEAVGNAISNGIMAWMTYGTSAAVRAAVMATLQPKQPIASTNAPIEAVVVPLTK
jgi:hypothetical protein